MLGTNRQNPFSLSVLNQAFTLTHNGELGTYQTTHLYIKYAPQTDSDYVKLLKSDLVLYDFPLTRKIVELNDYYHEWQDSLDYPELYTVIVPGQSVPYSAYIVLDYLNLTVEDTNVLKTAAFLTGNEDDLPSIVPKKETENEDGGGAGGGNGGGGVTECGCFYGNSRYPGGCVRVWDTEFENYLPVKYLKVTAKDNWFKINSTYTTSTGCWVIAKKHYGSIWVHFTFKNENIRIRSVHNSNSAISMAWATTVEHHLPKISGGTFNPILVKYGMWTDNGSISHVFWSSATTINAEGEMRAMASFDYIQYSSRQLEFVISHTPVSAGVITNYGFTLMKNYLGTSLTTNSIQAGIVGKTGFGRTLVDIIPPAYLTGMGITYVSVNLFAPDILVTDHFAHSDDFKQLIFHEMGHALHALAVGKLWWTSIIKDEIKHNEEYGLPYGDGSFTNSDKVALTESWAEFIGTYYVNLLYQSITGSNWNDKNEKLSIISTFIPEGLHYDLLDPANNGNNANEPEINGNNVADNVAGFSVYSIFSALGNFPNGANTFAEFKNNILANKGSNSTSQINSLFSIYGR